MKEVVCYTADEYAPTCSPERFGRLRFLSRCCLEITAEQVKLNRHIGSAIVRFSTPRRVPLFRHPQEVGANRTRSMGSAHTLWHREPLRSLHDLQLSCPRAWPVVRGGTRVTITVRPHKRIREAFRQYVRSLPGDRAEQVRTARERWDEFLATIVAAGGPPEGSIPDARFPSSYWCAFPGGILVLVHFPAPRRTGLFRSAVDALAIEMNFSPGLRD